MKMGEAGRGWTPPPHPTPECDVRPAMWPSFHLLWLIIGLRHLTGSGRPADPGDPAHPLKSPSPLTAAAPPPQFCRGFYTALQGGEGHGLRASPYGNVTASA